MRIKKCLSANCPVWSGICLSCGRCRRLYCCVAIDGGGSSPRRTWLELLLILVNSRSSPSSASWTKSGRSGGQYPHRLLRRRNASMTHLEDYRCFDCLYRFFIQLFLFLVHSQQSVRVNEQFLNGTSTHYRPFSAIQSASNTERHTRADKNRCF